MMMVQCPMIPIKQHSIYYNRVDADVIKGFDDLPSPKYLLDSALCYAKLKVIVHHTPAETCINEFHKTHNASERNFRIHSLDLVSPRGTEESSKMSCILSSTKGDWEFKNSNFKTHAEPQSQ